MDKYNILTEKEIIEKIKKLHGWKYKNNIISRELKFCDFLDVPAFLVRISPFFEKNEHHPEIKILYSKVNFELRDHKAGRITEIDFKTAIEIERLYKLFHNICPVS